MDGETFIIEVKASTNIDKPDTRGFKSFCTFFGKPVHKYIFYNGSVSKNMGDVLIRPWQTGMKELAL